MGASAFGGVSVQGGSSILNDLLPNQSGNAGKSFVTNGVTADWQLVGNPIWGGITGSLSSQIDLKNKLDSLEENSIIQSLIFG